MNRAWALTGAGLLLIGCGTQVDSTGVEPGGRAVDRVAAPTTVPAADGPVETAYAVTVLDDGDGAELCLGGVATSLPPQCGGPPISNWAWSEHAGDFDDVGGTRWGEFHVVGTFDGTTFAATEVTPGAAYDAPARSDEDDLDTPCSNPPGWPGEDPEQVSHRALDRAGRAVRRLPTYGYSWVDRARDLRSPEQVDQDAATGHGAVNTWILNVAVTDDLAAAEAAIREVWAGAYCVSRARWTDTELMATRRQLADLPGLQSMGSFRHIEVGVLHDDGSIQAWVDQEYGSGMVEIRSALVPVT